MSDRRGVPCRSSHYGRKRGRRLRPGRARLLETRLPALEFSLPAEGEGPLDPRSLFAAGIGEVWLEIGFGMGEHLAALAQAHPSVGLIGSEPYVNGVASLLRHADEMKLANLRIFPDDGLRLVNVLAEASIGRAIALFSDPWPKKRHHKRRLIRPDTLELFARILEDGAEFRLATDHTGYARWMLRHFMAQEAFVWTARRARDWRIRPADWPETRYEAKAGSEGRNGIFLTFRRRPRAA